MGQQSPFENKPCQKPQKEDNQSDNQKYQQFDDDFEDFGYEVKNIRRQTKKKVAKFKREVNDYDDTF